MMEKILEQFGEVLTDPSKKLDAWKIKNNKKIIGCLPMYIPEEIIHASGMLPMTLFGNAKQGNLADRHLLTFTCRGLRSSYDMLLNGAYDFLDGIVIPLICDQMRFTSDFWDMSHPFGFFHQMGLSFRVDDSGKRFMISEFLRLKSHLEEFIGQNISYAAIQKSIQVYNKNRSLLRKISDLRRIKPGVINESDMLRLVASSMILPKEEHNEMLIELLSQLKKVPARDGIGIVLIGHPCYPPDDKILDLIEELGGVILDDDLFLGRRYFERDINSNIGPIESLASHFMDSRACPIKHHPDHFLNTQGSSPDYVDEVIKLYKQSGAKGIINLGELFCDPYDFEYPYLKQRLEQEMIPFINISAALGSTSLEQVKTRMATFLEMLQPC